MGMEANESRGGGGCIRWGRQKWAVWARRGCRAAGNGRGLNWYLRKKERGGAGGGKGLMLGGLGCCVAGERRGRGRGKGGWSKRSRMEGTGEGWGEGSRGWGRWNGQYGEGEAPVLQILGREATVGLGLRMQEWGSQREAAGAWEKENALLGEKRGLTQRIWYKAAGTVEGVGGGEGCSKGDGLGEGELGGRGRCAAGRGGGGWKREGGGQARW